MLYEGGFGKGLKISKACARSGFSGSLLTPLPAEHRTKGKKCKANFMQNPFWSSE